MLAPWKKSMINLDSVLKSGDITLLAKVHIIKGMIFPVVMYRCRSWTIKKAEHQRIDAFKLWFWRRPLRVPRTARRSNHSILKEIKPEYSLEGLMLKLQYFGHLMQRADLLEKDTDAGKDWRQEEKGVTGMRWLDGIINLWTWVWANSGRLVKDREAYHAGVLQSTVLQSQTWLSDWTTTESRSNMIQLALKSGEKT